METQNVVWYNKAWTTYMNFSKCVISLEEEGIRKRVQFLCWCSKNLLNGKN